MILCVQPERSLQMPKQRDLESLYFIGKRYESKFFPIDESVTLFEQMKVYVWNNFLSDKQHLPEL